MKPEKLREMRTDELLEEERKLRIQMYKMRFQRVAGQMENPMKMRHLRRDIARIQTICRERGEQGAPAPAADESAS